MSVSQVGLSTGALANPREIEGPYAQAGTLSGSVWACCQRDQKLLAHAWIWKLDSKIGSLQVPSRKGSDATTDLS